MSYVYSTGLTPAEVYEVLHSSGDYGTTEHGLNTEHLYRDCQSLLDVGCGRSPFAGRLWAERPDLEVIALCDCSKAAIHWQAERINELEQQALVKTDGVHPDPIQPHMPLVKLNVTDLSRHGLPVFGDGAYDAVTCFDVLEHLPEDRVGFAISELLRVANKRVVITVGTAPSVRKGPGGEELHLTVRDEDWWLIALADAVSERFSTPPHPLVGLRTEQIEARIVRGQLAISTVFIMEFSPESGVRSPKSGGCASDRGQELRPELVQTCRRHSAAFTGTGAAIPPALAGRKSRATQATGGSISHVTEPRWVVRCRAELARLNGNYAYAFEVYWRVFGCDCTARQLRDRLESYGYSWAPSERRMREWLVEMLPVINKHKSRRDDG
jgi:hypothetical protein